MPSGPPRKGPPRPIAMGVKKAARQSSSGLTCIRNGSAKGTAKSRPSRVAPSAPRISVSPSKADRSVRSTQTRAELRSADSRGRLSPHEPWRKPEAESRAPALLRPLIDPGIYGFVPQLRILRLLHPVAFVGKIEHLRRDAFHLQRGEKLEAFAHVEAVVALAVDDQRRRLEILGVLVRRPFLVAGAIVVGSAFELPVVEPKFLGRAPGGLGIEHTVVRHQALEAVGVAEDPVDGVSAVAGAQRALAVLVDERIRLLRVVEALHQVFKRSTAPVAVDGVDELLPVSGRAVEVDHDDDVAIGREQFGIPAIAPVVSPGPLRPAVDEELHGIFLRGVEVRRLDQEALDFVVVSTGEPEGLERGHVNLRQDSVIEMCQRAANLFLGPTILQVFAIADLIDVRYLSPVDESHRAAEIDFRWRTDGHACEKQPFAVGRQSQIVIEARKKGIDLDIRLLNRDVVAFFCIDLRGETDRVHWRCSFILRDKIKMRRVRRPNITSHPLIETLGQIPLLTRLAVVEYEAEAVALVSRTRLGAVGDEAAIGRLER